MIAQSGPITGIFSDGVDEDVTAMLGRLLLFGETPVNDVLDKVMY